MPILGFRHTANFVTNERPEELAASHSRGNIPMVLLRSSPLTSLMKSESTDDPVFHWWQKNFDNRRLKFTSALTMTLRQRSRLMRAFKSAFIVKMGDMLLIEGTVRL